jgi:pyruvate/2-oxoglutarate dehydrogenase complex dihydrolipoamide acyltransferase (E2) component
VGDGSLVETGQMLYSLESDKSVQEIEAPAAGVLKILAPAGGTYSVGHVLAEIV